jgi:hypothetical protein
MVVLMVWVIPALVFAGLLGYLVWKYNEPETSLPPEVDPEQAVKAAIELHRIRRNLDVAWTKTEQRREGAALRREIAKTLKGEGGD